jgi:hypothetical protein
VVGVLGVLPSAFACLPTVPRWFCGLVASRVVRFRLSRCRGVLGLPFWVGRLLCQSIGDIERFILGYCLGSGFALPSCIQFSKFRASLRSYLLAVPVSLTHRGVLVST